MMNEPVMPQMKDEFVFGPQPPVTPVRLHAGPVTVEFDPEWGWLRKVCASGVEVLRAVYPSVRTDRWVTVKPVISGLVTEQRDGGFRVEYEAVCASPEQGLEFSFRGVISGEVDGTVSYVMDGAAGGEFLTNRTGLCVLHGNLAHEGRRVVVEHGAGGVTKGSFPTEISPWQPFYDVRALTTEVAPGLLAVVRCEGDDYEMEDQRNWTDGSFKTYAGPQKPAPNAVALPLKKTAGQRVRNEVRLEWRGTPGVEVPSTAAGNWEAHGAEVALPVTGTRWAPEVDLGEAELAALRGAGVGQLMIDVAVSSPDWHGQLRRGLEVARALGAEALVLLEAAADDACAVSELAEQLEGSGLRVKVAAVGAEPAALARRLMNREVLVAVAPGRDFADLNRNRPGGGLPWMVPMCPQVHAFDFESMLENLEAQSAVLASASGLSGQPLWVGPVALLRKRAVDARQGSLFAAAWLLGSVTEVIASGRVSSAVWFETAGPAGLAGTPSLEVLRLLAGAAGARRLHTGVARVRGLELTGPQGARRVVANLNLTPVDLVLPAPGRVLDGPEGWREVAAGPVRLGACGIFTT